MHELGISVYPDIKPLEEIKEYFKLASNYGVTRVFSSMFSVEGDKDTLLNYFKDLISSAHHYGLKVTLDVNPECFERINASYDNLKPFKDIDVDILRMDLNYGAQKDAILLKNPYGIKIEFNASMINEHYVEELKQYDVDPSIILTCHNFYPQRYTGMKWDKFRKVNRTCKEQGVRTAAFIASHAPNTHGVWDAKDGLPTVEKFRMLPIDTQYRILINSDDVDDIFIGNAYASKEEFEALKYIRDNSIIDEADPTIKRMMAYMGGKIKEPKLLKIIFEEDVSAMEKKDVLEFFPHLDLGDSSEYMWRSRSPRFIYAKETFTPRKCLKPYFKRGDVVIVNDNYKHYAAEVQIVLEDMENDGTRNLVGHIDENDLPVLELIKDLDIVKFIE